MLSNVVKISSNLEKNSHIFPVFFNFLKYFCLKLQNSYSYKSRVGFIQKIIKFYINLIINIIHILSNVVEISYNLKKTAIFSQFFKFFEILLLITPKRIYVQILD